MLSSWTTKCDSFLKKKKKRLKLKKAYIVAVIIRCTMKGQRLPKNSLIFQKPTTIALGNKGGNFLAVGVPEGANGKKVLSVELS